MFKVSKKILNKAKQYLKEDLSKNLKDYYDEDDSHEIHRIDPMPGNQYYGFLSNSKLYDVGLTGPNACYAATTELVREDHVLMIDKSINKKKLIEHKDYINYCINESFLSHVFVSKDIDEVIDMGGTILDVRYSGSEVISAAITTRYASEFSVLLDAWTFMVKNGMEKDIASILSHYYSLSKDSKELILSPLSSGHTWLNNYDSVNNYKMIFKNIYTKKLRKDLQAFNVTRSYNPTDQIFCNEGLKSKSIDVTKVIPFYLGEESSFKNSLGKTKKTVSYITADNVKNLQNWFLDFIGEE